MTTPAIEQVDGLPLFSGIVPQDIKPAIEKAIEHCKATIDEVVESNDFSYANVVAKIEEAENAILSFTEKNNDIASYEFVWRHARALAERNDYPVFRVCFITTFTSRLLEPYLCTNLVMRGVLPKINFIEYQQWQITLMKKGQIDDHAPDLIIALLHVDDVLPYLTNRHLSKSDELDQEENLFIEHLIILKYL